MSLFPHPRAQLRKLLLNGAAERLKGGDVDWAAAMSAELEACPGETQRLGWAFGCWRASFGAPGGLDGVTYAAALGLGVTLMTAQQWKADEGVATLALLGVVSLVLGLMRPGRAWLSGVVIGLVVTAILLFELISGLRPAYEQGDQTLSQCLQWLVFAPPALVAATLGGWLRRRFDPGAATR